MFKLGFCVYGPQCRYRHTRVSGPPPDPSTIEAAKPRDFRNINVVVNSVNTGIALGERPGITAGRGRGHARFVLAATDMLLIILYDEDADSPHCCLHNGTCIDCHILHMNTAVCTGD